MFRFTLSDRRELRVLEDSDAAELYALIEANRAYLARWLPWAPGQTLDATRAFIAYTRKQLAGNDGFQCAILDDGGSSGRRLSPRRLGEPRDEHRLLAGCHASRVAAR